MTEIYVGGVCNNNCLTCETDKSKFKDCKDIIRELDKVTDNKVTFIGGEPTIHPQFFDILKYAKSKKILEIGVITNGRMFALNHFLVRCLEHGLTEAVIKFYSADYEVHDNITRTKNSYYETMQGIRNLSMSDIKLTVKLYILEQNHKSLKSIIDFLNLNMTRNIVLYFLALDEKVTARYTDIKHSLFEVLESNRYLRVQNIPLCILSEHANHNEDIKLGVKTKYCLACTLDASCRGFNKKYIENYGEEEFKFLGVR